ncbi:hypothetical protein E4U41_002036 [Claviceps citrina]|nr:hypothetical protein E4U41_002036 [Claviceps citrina]
MARRTQEFDRGQMHNDSFAPIMPDHPVAMMSSDPRLKDNRELVKGLMSPQVLSDDFAPVIYEKTRQLVDLWKAKMDAAQGRHFSALQDLRELSVDVTLALIFGLDEGRRITRRHQDYLSSRGSSAVCADSADIACFARPRLTPEVDALSRMPEFLHFAGTCIAPHVQIWVLKRTKWRKYFQAKEKLLSDEINKSVQRLSTVGSDSSTCKPVIDHILKRETLIAEKTQSRPNFGKANIRDELFGFFIAGSDTVATTMGWTVKFLADHETVQAKLRRQLRVSYPEAHSQRRQPDVSEIVHTPAPYLDAFMEESLRCAKTVPMLIRQTTVDTELFGHHVPKDTTILVTVWGPSVTEPAMPAAHGARSPSSQAHSQRLPSWAEDEVTHFKPERWLKMRDSTRTGVDEFDNLEHDCNAGPMLTFGAGPRGCFGKRLAHLEMKIMIALLVWNFSFQKCAEHLSIYVEHDELTCMPARCYVKLERAD